MARVIAVGASNLTLGLQSLIATARMARGADVEVLAAVGYGRSYGAPSTIGPRTLPGILQSNLWSELSRLNTAPTEALITDVGNDVLYGVPPSQILAWVDETAARLLAHSDRVVVTDLPVSSIDALTPARFLFFRTLFFPPCRLSRNEVFDRVRQVNDGLADLAVKRDLRFVHLKPHWYGLDPIHVRPAYWREAWREILLGDEDETRSAPFLMSEWAGLHRRPPERQWMFGRERVRPQSGVALKNGGRLWLY